MFVFARSVLLSMTVALIVMDSANGFCFHAPGGVGEYHKACDEDSDIGKLEGFQKCFCLC